MTRRRWHLVSVYPDLLGTYGDQGNAVVLERRLAWRGLDVRLTRVPFGDPVPADGDLYLLGGGEDEAQTHAVEELRRSTLPSAVRAGAHVFAVCAGLQLLGQSFDSGARVVEGLGLVDAMTTRLASRVVGEVLVAAEGSVLTGFTNHAGATVLGSEAEPLGRVLAGRGNTGQEDDVEGVLQGTVVGTYLHGPVLARNPAFADWLLSCVLGAQLPPMDGGVPEQLHARRSRLAGEPRRKRRAATKAV